MTKTSWTTRTGIVLASTLGLASVASANKTDDSIDTIVVVGETTNREVDAESIQRHQANDLADIFRYTPSVSVGGSLGLAQKVYVRGLEDTFLNVTVDGAPQTGTLFHHTGRVTIEPELLESVELQAGAGEATSGAGALGGALRFYTKSVNDLLEGDKTTGAITKASYFSNDGNKLSATGYGRVSDSWGVLGSIVDVKRHTMKDGGGDTLYGTASNQRLLFVKTDGQLSDNQYLTVSVERRNEDGEFGVRPNWPATQGDNLFPVDSQRTTFVINHRLTLNEQINTEMVFYHTSAELEQDRFDRWGKYGAGMTSYGFDLRNASNVAAHQLTYGLEYRKDTVSSEYLGGPDAWANSAWDPNIGKFEEEGAVQSAYLQDHWLLSTNFLLSAGIRYDRYQLDQKTYHNDTSSAGWSPNIGVSYDLNDFLTVNAGYAEAIRGKEVGDAFTLEIEPGTESLAPNLKAETVNNKEVSLEYTDNALLASVAVYQSRIDNVIQDQLGRGTYYENIGEFESNGFELQAEYQWQQLSIYAGFSHNDVQLNNHDVDGYEHISLATSRGDTWNIGVHYDLNDQWEMGWNYTRVDDLNNLDVLHRGVEIGWIDETQQLDKPGYDLHDIYTRWQSFSGLTIDLSVENLFNKAYRDHSSVGDYNHISGWEGVAGVNEAGRNIKVSTSYTF